MTMRVLSGRSVTFGSPLDPLHNRTKKNVDKFDRRWFTVALNILIGTKFKIFNSTKSIVNKDIDSLKIRLKELDEKIKAVEKQLPAHSVKPTIMTQLFELEDERDAAYKQLERLKQASVE
jgi:hypothetical protein